MNDQAGTNRQAAIIALPVSSAMTEAGWEKCFKCNANTKHLLPCRRIYMCQKCASVQSPCIECGDQCKLVTDPDLVSPILHLENAREHHKLACLHTTGTQFREHMQKTLEAAEACVMAYDLVPIQEMDTGLFAEGLLLHATAIAALHVGFVRASSSANRAAWMLHGTKHPQFGNALRVMGMVELQFSERCPSRLRANRALQQAMQHFLSAIRVFREQRLETSVVWSAVSYWDMFLVKEKLEGWRAAVPWLKRAIQLQVKIQGADNQYTELYQRRLAETLNVPVSNDVPRMSQAELADIRRCIDGA